MVGFRPNRTVSIAFRLSVQSPHGARARKPCEPAGLHCLSAFCPVTARKRARIARARPSCLHCLSAFCPVTARLARLCWLRFLRVSIAFRLSVQSPLLGIPPWILGQRYCLHCLSAFCPVTAEPDFAAWVAAHPSPLPFGFLSSHRLMLQAECESDGRSSPLPFGFLSSHRGSILPSAVGLRTGVSIAFRLSVQSPHYFLGKGADHTVVSIAFRLSVQSPH